MMLLSLLLGACSDNEQPDPSKLNPVQAPSTYEFLRDGESTVAFPGQTERIRMAMEMASALSDFSTSGDLLLEMFRNQTSAGGDANPFSEDRLNLSAKSIREKVAASKDFFSTNATESAQIRADFENWISGQVNEVFPGQNELAAPGKAGQIADGTSTRYVSGRGLEYNQIFQKSLIGALMLDQIINNYVSPDVLDAGSNRADNDLGVLHDENKYTVMEHLWDEAYGYVFGNSANPAAPLDLIGTEDRFLNNYIGKVDSDPDFRGIAERIYRNFIAGRAAIVQKEYGYRTERANDLRRDLSKVIAIRAVYYLESAAMQIEESKMGSAFHSLSEGIGFIYSLRFTHNPALSLPYFSKTETENFRSLLLEQPENGFWDVSPTMLRSISAQIAERFGFDQAKTVN